MTTSLSDTPPRRIVETQYTLSDDDSSRPSRNYQHHHLYHHHHNDYDDDDDDDGDDDDGEDYNHGPEWEYCARHAKQVADDNISLISAPTKKRVRDIDPNNGRCLVENCIEHAGVIYCYCFPIYAPDTDPDLLDNIEWFWNIPYYTLNLQSSRNVFRAGAAITQLYQKHFWLVLPEEVIINQYHSTLTEIDGTWIAHRESFPDIPDRNDFEYRFIPISDQMRQIPISRQLRHPEFTDPPLSANDFLILLYPFAEMPILKSHVHPRYALLEAGRKLTKRLAKEKLTQLLEEYPLLKKVVQIYGAWSAKRPDNAMEDRSYNLPEDPRDDDNDDDDGDGEKKMVVAPVENDDDDEKEIVVAPIENGEDGNCEDDEDRHGDKDASMKDIDTANADDGTTTDPDVILRKNDQNQKKRKYSDFENSAVISHDSD